MKRVVDDWPAAKVRKNKYVEFGFLVNGPCKYAKSVGFFVSLVSPKERAITDRDPAILVKPVRAIFPPHFQKLHD